MRQYEHLYAKVDVYPWKLKRSWNDLASRLLDASVLGGTHHVYRNNLLLEYTTCIQLFIGTNPTRDVRVEIWASITWMQISIGMNSARLCKMEGIHTTCFKYNEDFTTYKKVIRVKQQLYSRLERSHPFVKVNGRNLHTCHTPGRIFG
jgi:hypothetical protein